MKTGFQIITYCLYSVKTKNLNELDGDNRVPMIALHRHGSILQYDMSHQKHSVALVVQ